MKAIVATVVAMAVLYAVDREYTGGQYTSTAQLIIVQIEHSIGI
ncbi:hypothetical protein [Bradyrhizobium sp.]